MLDVSGFRQVFPELDDVEAAPDFTIQFYLDFAYDRLNAAVWGSSLDRGAAFYAAHYIALAVQRAAVARIAGPLAATTAGAITGIVTSKSVGPVSKSMDVSTGSVEGGGDFNTTTYGRTYLTLLGTVGAGVMQF